MTSHPYPPASIARGLGDFTSTLMAATSSRPSPPTRLQLANDRSQIEAVRDLIVDAMSEAGYPEAAFFAVRLAFEEAVSNAFRHGHKDLDLPITVEFSVVPDRVEIVVEDFGPGFDPASVPDPTLDENLEQPGGRGLLLMRAYMSEVTYSERGNLVRMVYRLPTSGTQSGGKPKG